MGPDAGAVGDVVRTVSDPTTTYWVQLALALVAAMMAAGAGLFGYGKRVRRAEGRASAALKAAEAAASKTSVAALERQVEGINTAIAELRRNAATHPELSGGAEVHAAIAAAVELERRARAEAIELLRQECAKIRAEILTAAHAGEARWNEMHRSLGRIEGVLSTLQEA
jgi:hypothetical protein